MSGRPLGRPRTKTDEDRLPEKSQARQALLYLRGLPDDVYPTTRDVAAFLYNIKVDDLRVAGMATALGLKPDDHERVRRALAAFLVDRYQEDNATTAMRRLQNSKLAVEAHGVWNGWVERERWCIKMARIWIGDNQDKFEDDQRQLGEVDQRTLRDHQKKWCEERLQWLHNNVEHSPPGDDYYAQILAGLRLLIADRIEAYNEAMAAGRCPDEVLLPVLPSDLER
jgi:hypothetical protein